MAQTKGDPVAVDLGTPEDEERLIAQYVRPHAHESGRAYAVVADAASVSAVIRSWQFHEGDLEAVAASWRMPVDGVLAALAFYRRNRAIIDARILLEDDAWDPDFGGRRGRPLS